MSVLVTGAGGAIGGAIVDLLAARGTRVVAHDLRFAGAEARPDVVRVEGDLRAPETVGALLEGLGDGPLHGVVAAHGIEGAGPLGTIPPARVRDILEINGALVPRLYALLEERLADAGGAFVAVTSQAALRAEPENAVYTAAKWGALGWVRSIHRQAAARGVAVRAVCPGRTVSPLLERSSKEFARAQGLTDEAFAARIFAAIPAGRYAQPSEIAHAVGYLLGRDGPRPVVLAVTGGEVPSPPATTDRRSQP